MPTCVFGQFAALARQLASYARYSPQPARRLHPYRPAPAAASASNAPSESSPPLPCSHTSPIPRRLPRCPSKTGSSPGSRLIVCRAFPPRARAGSGRCRRLPMVSGGTASDLHRTSLLNSNRVPVFRRIQLCPSYHASLGVSRLPAVRFGHFCEIRLRPLMLCVENVDKTG